MSCCIVQGTEMLSGSMLTQRRKQSLCQTSCLWASSYFSLSSDALLDVFALHLPNQVCCFDPIQDRSRAGRYQVSPDMQHVLFAFEVKLVRNVLFRLNVSRRRPSLTPVPFVFISADLPAFLRGQVHYLQPGDTVRPTSAAPPLYCLLSFRLFRCSRRSLSGQSVLSLTSCKQSTDISPYLPALATNLWEYTSPFSFGWLPSAWPLFSLVSTCFFTVHYT